MPDHRSITVTRRVRVRPALGWWVTLVLVPAVLAVAAWLFLGDGVAEDASRRTQSHSGSTGLTSVFVVDAFLLMLGCFALGGLIAWLLAVAFFPRADEAFTHLEGVRPGSNKPRPSRAREARR